jgi:FMN-dependent NADH-azoreductase
MEHQESYLQTVFGFLGITDVRFVRAEGLAMGEAAKTQALEAAALEIRAIALTAANEASAVRVA